MFAKADLAPSFGMEFGSNETIKQAVMAGLGVAFISAHTVAAEVAQGRMIVLQVTGLPVVRKWYLLRAKAKHLLPAGTACGNSWSNTAGGFHRTYRHSLAARNRAHDRGSGDRLMRERGPA
jgi:hypothetical protein